MIFYKRTEWYGLQYLLKLDGSLLPKTLPSMILAGVISGLTTAIGGGIVRDLLCLERPRALYAERSMYSGELLIQPIIPTQSNSKDGWHAAHMYTHSQHAPSLQPPPRSA